MATLVSPITVDIGNVRFLAAPLNQARFDEKGAIHIVFDRDEDGVATILDVSESSESGESPLNTPDRRAAWLQQSKTQDIWVGSYLEPVETLFSKAKNAADHRAQLVAKLRQEYLAS